MKYSTLLASALASGSPALARIYGIAVPETVAPGSEFSVIIETQNYIQSVQDVAISFGYAPQASPDNEGLGVFLNSRFLGPNESNIITNITDIVQIPQNAAQGPIAFKGALFSLIGADYLPSISDFTVNITITDETSGTYVSSTQ